MKLSILFFLVGLLGTAAICQPSASGITIGHVDSVYSALLKENRRVLVYTPSGAASGQNNVKYPVVYLLDGGMNFHAFVGTLIHLSEVNNVCPRMIVVGILNTDRTRDLTPTHVSYPPSDSAFLKTSGGGERFTQFIEKELIPYIDSRYRASPDRMLVGHSLGGLFVVNTMMRHTDLFRQYVSIDPSLTWDGQKVLAQYQKELLQKKFTGKSFFLTGANFAGMDSLSARNDTSHITVPTRSVFTFADALKNKKDSGLDWACRYYADENHTTVPLISEYDALRFIFRKKAIPLSLEQLKALEGKYQRGSNPDQNTYLQITIQNGQLLLKQLWDGHQMRLVAESDVSFYCREFPFNLAFIKDKNGTVKQVLVMNTDLWTKVEK